MTTPTLPQVRVLQHTLGLRVDVREPYRNHFVAGPGHHDLPDLEALEAHGLMQRVRPPGFLPERAIVFAVTEAGRRLAIEALPPPPQHTRYRDFLSNDRSESFGEFLCGGSLPKMETEGVTSRWSGTKALYRMFRDRPADDGRWERDVQGEWCATKQDAKATYKDALKARMTALRLARGAASESGIPAEDSTQEEESGERTYGRGQRGG